MLASHPLDICVFYLSLDHLHDTNNLIHVPACVEMNCATHTHTHTHTLNVNNFFFLKQHNQ